MASWAVRLAGPAAPPPAPVAAWAPTLPRHTLAVHL